MLSTSTNMYTYYVLGVIYSPVTRDVYTKACSTGLAVVSSTYYEMYVEI